MEAVKKDAEERMEKALAALERDFSKLRTGRASTSLVDGLNGVLGQGAQGLAQGAASLGQQLFEGITGRFGDVASLAGQLSGTLQDTFAALKGPLGTAAKAISTALSGNLLSAFPTIFAAMGTLVTTVGSAFVAMLELARENLLEITQGAAFAPIYVRLVYQSV